MSRFTLAVAALALSVGSAYAATPTLTATLAAPSAKATIITDHTIWKCDGTTCTTRSVAEHSFTVGECRVLAQKSGAAVTAYATATETLAADRLATCNTN